MPGLTVAILYDRTPKTGSESPGWTESALSDRTVESARAALESLGWRAVRVPFTGLLGELVRRLERSEADVVLNLCEAAFGRSGLEASVAGALDLCGLPYTGSPPAALALALNKPQAKAVLAAAGIPTPRGRVFRQDEAVEPGHLRFPLIVKPAQEDASLGITPESVVRDEAALRDRTGWVIRTFGPPALVEEFVDGRELNAAVLGNDPPGALPVSEIDFSGMPAGLPHVVTHAAKWRDDSTESKGTTPCCPARGLSPDLQRTVERLALGAYRAIGCRDYARVDLRIAAMRGATDSQCRDPQGGISQDGVSALVLEVNPNPDLSPDAGMARSAAAAGWEYPELLRRIVTLAQARPRQAAPEAQGQTETE